MSSYDFSRRPISNSERLAALDAYPLENYDFERRRPSNEQPASLPAGVDAATIANELGAALRRGRISLELAETGRLVLSHILEPDFPRVVPAHVVLDAMAVVGFIHHATTGESHSYIEPPARPVSTEEERAVALARSIRMAELANRQEDVHILEAAAVRS